MCYGFLSRMTLYSSKLTHVDFVLVLPHFGSTNLNAPDCPISPPSFSFTMSETLFNKNSYSNASWPSTLFKSHLSLVCWPFGFDTLIYSSAPSSSDISRRPFFAFLSFFFLSFFSFFIATKVE